MVKDYFTSLVYSIKLQIYFRLINTCLQVIKHEKPKLVSIFQTKMQKGPYDPTDVINANLWGPLHIRPMLVW